jgi:N-acetylmuramoyl-L-alanine amidase
MKKLCQPQTFLLVILSIFIAVKSFSISPENKNSKPLVVVIDPGHGGKDPGAVSKGIREKDVVLGIGLKLGKYINENFPEVKVIFTRNTDVFVPLIDRSRIANKNKADLFISLHANHCGTPATRGTETFVLGLHRSDDNLEVAKKENSVILLEDDYTTIYEGFDPNLSESYIMFELVQDIYMDQSLSFADAIQNQFKTKLETSNRGVKQAGFLVLRQSSMPSVLVETGFLSNITEANYLNSNEGQQKIALSILEAFRKFRGKNNGSNAPVFAETKSTPDDRQNPVETKKTEATQSTSTEQKQQSFPVNVPENKTVEKKAETDKPAINTEIKEVIPETKPVEKTDQKPELKTLSSEVTTTTQPKTVPKEVEKTDKTNLPITSESLSPASGGAYFSVQIGANTTPIEPVPVNFKGLKNVRREKSDKYYRYFVGKESSLEKIMLVWQQIKSKFPQSFIVSFVDGKRIIIN